MIIQGAIPYENDEEKDELIRNLRIEFDHKIKITVDRIGKGKFINYWSYSNKTVEV